MSRHPLLVALDGLDDAPSPEFSATMRARLFEELVQPGASVDSSEHDDVSSSPGDIGDSEVRVAPIDAPSKRRTRTVLGAAAAILLVAALSVVVLNRRSEPPSIDTSRDPEIAQAALMRVADLGIGWEETHDHDDFTTAVEARVAAGVPSCGPYVDYAFDSPNSDASVSQRLYQSPTLAQLWNIVYVFPTKEAASQVMDKVAEQGFLSCFTEYLVAAQPVLSPGTTSTSEAVAAPPLLQHGDRQVAFGTSNVYQTPSGPIPLTSVNIFIQVDRAVVYINPRPDFHDSLDPKGRLELAMTVATDSVRAALEAGK
jgi:hypothetical protein